jgi:hypothetical protein
MVEEPSHVKKLSLNHVCKIGLKKFLISYFCFFKKMFSSNAKKECRSPQCVLAFQNSRCTLPLNNPFFIFQNKKRKIFRRILIGLQKGFSGIFITRREKYVMRRVRQCEIEGGRGGATRYMPP